MTSKTKQFTLATSEAVKQIGHTVQSAMHPGDSPDSPESPSQARTLQYTRRGLKMVGEKSLFDLKEPVWHPDEKSPMCDKCHAQFTLLNRRHHCRRCGDVVCGSCCDRTPLSRMGYVDPVLVCRDCAPICKSEEEFMHNQLKQLMNGAHFHLSDSPDPTHVYFLRLSTDHKQIVMGDDHLPINMRHILEVKTLAGDQFPDQEPDETQRKKRSGSGSGKVISLELIHKVAGGEEGKLTLIPSSSHHRKTSVDWLRALKKALIVLHNK